MPLNTQQYVVVNGKKKFIVAGADSDIQRDYDEMVKDYNDKLAKVGETYSESDLSNTQMTLSVEDANSYGTNAATAAGGAELRQQGDPAAVAASTETPVSTVDNDDDDGGPDVSIFDDSSDYELPDPQQEAQEAVEHLYNFIETKDKQVSVLYDTHPNAFDDFDTGSDNPANTTYYTLKEKLNSEGFSEEFPQIIAMTEFKHLFTFVDAGDPRSLSLSRLSSIIENSELRETSISKLLEIQMHVRKICSKNTKELFNIFNKGFTPTNFKTSVYTNLETLLIDIQNINTKTEFLNDIAYDFTNDVFSVNDVIERLKETGKPKATAMAAFISANSMNPYVLAVLRYFILITFAKNILRLLQKKLEAQGSFLNSFYTDVVVNSNINDRDLKRVFDELGLSINDFGDFLLNIFVADLPVSTQVARLIKAIHSLGSGFVDEHVTTGENIIFNNTQLDEADGYTRSSVNSFLDASRKMKYESFIKHAYKHNGYDTNSLYETEPTDATSIIALLSPYFFNRNLPISSYGSLIRALLPLVYDIKNTLGFQNDENNKDAQIGLIESHLHPAGINDTNISNNATTNIDTTKDVHKYYNRSVDINFSSDPAVAKSIINTSDFGNIVYQNHDDKTIIVLDTNGIVHKDETEAIGTDNIESLRGYAFSMDDFEGDNIDKVYQEILPAVKNITNEFKDKYGIKDLSSISHIPEDYFTNFFDNLADMIQDLRYLNTTSDTRIMEAIALTFAATNEKINKKTFSAAAILHHNIKIPDTLVYRSTIGSRAQCAVVPPELESNSNFSGQADFNSGAEGTDTFGAEQTVLIKVHNTQAYNGGEIPYLSDDTDYEDQSVDRSVFDYLFTCYYDKLIPGTRMTVGGGSQDNDTGEESNLNQVYLNAVYKNMIRKNMQTYDGDTGNLVHYWDESSDAKLKTIGTPKTSTLSVPSKANTEYGIDGTWSVGKINKPFERMFNKNKSANNQLLRFAFAHDEDFLEALPDIADLIPDDGFLNKTSSTAYGSTSLARSYLLYFLMVRIFSTSLSFTFKTTGLGDENDKEKFHETRKISIHYNIEQFEAMYDALKGNDKDESKYDDESNPTYKEVFDNVKLIRDFAMGRVEFHDKGMIIALASFNKIIDYFRKFRDNNNVTADDNPQTLTASSYLNSLSAQGDRFFEYYNLDQFKLNTIGLFKLMQPSVNNFYLPSSKDITPNQMACMRKFLSYGGQYSPGSIPRNRFAGTSQEEANITSKKYILHVGITNNMLSKIRSQQLQNMQTMTGLQLNEAERQEMRDQYDKNSIIRINLFRKNMMSGEEVSVKSYLFDTSKFIVENVNDPQFLELHTQFARSNIKLKNFITGHRFYHVDKNMQIHTMSPVKILRNNSEKDYQNLDETEKKDLIMNHLNDHYLKMYCKSVLGLDYDEDIYHFNSAIESTLSQGFDRGFAEKNYNNAFLKPITEVLKTSRRSYLQERNRIESEAQRSIFFSPKKYLNRTILPKTFDRVFALYLNMDELDMSGGVPEASNQSVFLDQFYCTISLTPKTLLPDDSSLPADFMNTPAGESVLNTASTIQGTLAASGFFNN